MIACDGDDVDTEFEHESTKHVVEKANGLDRRHGAIVEVSRDDDAIGLKRSRDVANLIEDPRLVVEERRSVKNATDVPISGMKDAQSCLDVEQFTCPMDADEATPCSAGHGRRATVWFLSSADVPSS